MSIGGILFVLTVTQLLLLHIHATILFLLMQTNSFKRMQKSNGTGMHQACAACKHQRKKCRENCVLAPFFPAEQSQNFLAVHKVFGVSNVQKIVRSLQTKEQRVKAVESLIWEATLRQKDPVNGGYGEYLKVANELHCLRAATLQLVPTLQVPADNRMMYTQPSFVGWNSNSNGLGQRGMGIGMNNSSGFNFTTNGGNMILDSTQNGHVTPEQTHEKLSQGRNPRNIGYPIQSTNGVNERYYVPDQLPNVRSTEEALWDRE